VPLTPLATNLVCDVAAVSDEIAAAIAAHDSQRRSTDRCRRMRRYAGRFYRLDAAEEFWQVTAGQYAVLHGAERMPWKAFVSLREHPIYDARAYLSGLGERRRLVRVVSDA